MFFIDSHLILLDIDAADAEEVIRMLCTRLEEAGHVTCEHVNYVLERENVYPTGLPTNPFCVAIPHGEAEGVIHSALAFARMQAPVVFKNMVNCEECLETKMVFLLVNKDPSEQVKTLQNLSEIFGDPALLQQLNEEMEKQKVVALLESIINQ
ncbi:MAG: PTS sugar transporter subunit IIA [Chloroflexi bacterium]|nr:PTS sugar transporter subunit IIA [Chloroflexota bacterium]